MSYKLVVAAGFVCLLFACSSSSTGGTGAAGDGGSSGGGPTGGTSPAQADNTCAPYYKAADSSVTNNHVDGAAPTAAGGSVADGDYVLTDVTYYGVTPASAKTNVTQLHFSGAFQEYTDGPAPSAGDPETAQIIGRSYDTAGSRIAFVEVCHTPVSFYVAGSTYAIDYTATATTYVELQGSGSGKIVSTYTRQ